MSLILYSSILSQINCFSLFVPRCSNKDPINRKHVLLTLLLHNFNILYSYFFYFVVDTTFIEKGNDKIPFVLPSRGIDDTIIFHSISNNILTFQ